MSFEDFTRNLFILKNLPFKSKPNFPPLKTLHKNEGGGGTKQRRAAKAARPSKIRRKLNRLIAQSASRSSP
jgi:hypothetical protein